MWVGCSLFDGFVECAKRPCSNAAVIGQSVLDAAGHNGGLGHQAELERVSSQLKRSEEEAKSREMPASSGSKSYPKVVLPLSF